jgi:hypothetical protein
MSAGRVAASASAGGQRNIANHLSLPKSVNDRDLINDYYRLKLLYESILYECRAPMGYYGEGQFETFMNSTPNILNLTRLVNNDDFFFLNEPNPIAFKGLEYEEGLVDNYRFVTNRVIDTIKQAMTEYIKVTNLEARNAELEQYKTILFDREKLIAYLEEQSKITSIFSADATVKSDNVKIKTWYSLYMARYGPPGDGVFNSEPLADIIEELLAGDVEENGVIFEQITEADLATHSLPDGWQGTDQLP